MGFSSDTITVLSYLLPGFVAAWIFYGLTSYPKPSQFERVIQALIFTALIQGSVWLFKKGALLIGENFFTMGTWTTEAAFISSLVLAGLLGLLSSAFANNDRIHKILRTWRITFENSFASEWFSAFARRETYVVLHLKGERRLYGWPQEWPTDPNTGHFLITEAEWLLEHDVVTLENVESILIPVSEVEMVEFMNVLENTDEPKEEHQNG